MYTVYVYTLRKSYCIPTQCSNVHILWDVYYIYILYTNEQVCIPKSIMCTPIHKLFRMSTDNNQVIQWPPLTTNLTWIGRGYVITTHNFLWCAISRPCHYHYCDVIMGPMASLITSLTSVYSIVHSGADQRKHQSSASLAFVRGIHRRPVNSPHKWPVTRKMFPFDDVIMMTTTEHE